MNNIRKHSLLFIITLFSVFCSTNSNGQDNGSITGLWADSNSTSFQNCYVIFSQDGNDVHLVHYLEYEGTSMVEHGSGKRKGNKVEYNVKVTKAIPGWSTSGKHSLVLSEDGKTLRGTFSDAKGNTGPIVFKRIK